MFTGHKSQQGAQHNDSNFFIVGTNFDQKASTLITEGSPPFAGTFQPSPGNLDSFNGGAQSGTWNLLITDNSAGVASSLTFWCIFFQ